MIETIITDDGSLTARHKLIGDLYHSSRGALGEAMHVYIENAFKFYMLHSNNRDITVFDMGLGAALNAWLTLKEMPDDVRVKYISVEKFPLSFQEQLSFKFSDSPLYINLLSAPWNKITIIRDNFSILKIKGDVLEFDFDRFFPINVVYWDAFSPDSQPELWTEELFKKLRGGLSSDCVLSTYSAKGLVKNALRDSGFIIKRLPGAMGKRHMLRARLISDNSLSEVRW